MAARARHEVQPRRSRLRSKQRSDDWEMELAPVTTGKPRSAIKEFTDEDRSYAFASRHGCSFDQRGGKHRLRRNQKAAPYPSPSIISFAPRQTCIFAG